MGSGSTAYRIAAGEARAVQEHELAMIPILKQRGEMELELREKAFEQETKQKEAESSFQQSLFAAQLEQAEKLLSFQAEQIAVGEKEPIVTATTPVVNGVSALVSTVAPGVSQNVIYVGLALLALLFLRK